MSRREHIETRVKRLEEIIADAEQIVRRRFLYRAALTVALSVAAAAAYVQWGASWIEKIY